ncbi:MAG: M48 family metalloprotease [Gammaproteobacteria bacterium]|jgi:predicted Zn-dependent protease
MLHKVFTTFAKHIGSTRGGHSLWPPFFLSLLLTFQPALAAENDLNLPDIGDPASQVMTPRQESILGQELLRQIRGNLKLVTDPLLNSYIQSLGDRLAAHSGSSQHDFHFLIADDPNINAFATPGGVIVVNSGLILTVKDESELAAVMAHEVAHVTQRHIARMYASSKTFNITTGLALLAAIIAGAYNPEVGQAAALSTLAAGEQHRLNFSRANEEEADRVGIQILAHTGYDPEAMPDFFAQLQRQTLTGSDQVPEFLRTHPVTANRLADSRARADQFKGKFRKDSVHFEIARARLQALETPAADMLAQYEKSGAAYRSKTSSRYAYAIALIRSGRYAPAIKQLQALTKASPNEVAFQLSLAQAHLENGDLKTALEQFERLNNVYPGYEPVMMAYGNALIRAGRYDQAYRLLNNVLSTQPDNPEVFMILAKAADKAGYAAVSHEALAEYSFAHAQYNQAREQLQIALRNHPRDSITRERIQSKLKLLSKVPEQNK